VASGHGSALSRKSAINTADRVSVGPISAIAFTPGLTLTHDQRFRSGRSDRRRQPVGVRDVLHERRPFFV
jgi:hypothetical protein